MIWNLSGVYNSDENKKGLFENHILFIEKKCVYMACSHRFPKLKVSESDCHSFDQ